MSWKNWEKFIKIIIITETELLFNSNSFQSFKSYSKIDNLKKLIKNHQLKNYQTKFLNLPQDLTKEINKNLKSW